MRPYLNDYFQTLYSNQRERAADLLEEARLSKTQLDIVADKLKAGVTNFNSLNLNKESKNSIIDATNLKHNLRSMQLYLRDLYSNSNLVALLLSGESAVLTSEIKAIEDDLLAMEKLVDNFAFLISDSKTYNFSHLEPFSDERGRDDKLVDVSDRSGRSFSALDFASVKSDEGVLMLPESEIITHGMTGDIIDGNATAYTVFDTGIENAILKSKSRGWIVKMATAGAITTGLKDANGVKGAQIMVEFRLQSPSPSSEIKMSPFADIDIEVAQIIVYTNDSEDSGEKLLSSKVVLDRPISFNFPIKSISRFKVLLNQPTYDKIVGSENQVETEYRKTLREVGRVTRSAARRPFKIRRLERSVQSSIDIGSDTFYSSSIPSTDLRPDRGPMDPVRLELTSRYKKTNTWKSTGGKFSHIMYETLNQRTNIYNSILRDNAGSSYNRLGRLLSGDAFAVSQVIPLERSRFFNTFEYGYTLGLQNIAIGIGSPSYKGVFVSRPLPSSGDIGELKLRAGIDNFMLPFSDVASSYIQTSVEFSVTNKPNPDSEEDWIPIHPVNTRNRVESERLFFDRSGSAQLRFNALNAYNSVVYKNGIPTTDFKRVSNGAYSFSGIKVDPTTIYPQDVYTIEYFVDPKSMIVVADQLGLDDIPIVSAFDSTGAGESFASTYDTNLVTLKHLPYIDYERVSDETYNPIVVEIIGDDTVVPLNITDYVTSIDIPLPENDSGYYYIHSGRTLRFNRAINKPLRVYYTYLQNNVRFRVVLRCNSRDFVSPKVDFVQVKAKTRKPNRREK